MGDIRHTRKVPEEWPGLLAFSKEIIPPDSPRDRAVKGVTVARLLWRIGKMDHQRLEANNYFGLGEVMTGMHMRLQDPYTRRQVVQEAAKLMVTRAVRLRGSFMPRGEPFVPLVNDLSSYNLEQPFRRIAAEEMAFLPLAEQGLIRGLSIATAYGRWPPKLLQAKLLQRMRPLTVWKMTRQVAMQEIPVENIARNTLSGALTVWKRLLLARDPGQAFYSHNLVAIHPEDVKEVQRSRAFIASAGLRIDEFKGKMGWTGNGGGLWFDPGVLATPPPPLPLGHPDLEGATNMHYDRLICPAVHAGGLAGEVAREIVPEIIGAARLLIPSEVVLPREAH